MPEWLASASNIHYSGYMDLDAATSALAALAQPTRLETFRLLVRHEPDGLPAGEIARQLDIPQNTMSAHLAVLARAGLAVGARHSRSIIYRADLNRLRDLMLYLVRDCCGGNAALCAPLIAELSAPCCPAEGARA
jgi:ArsR family transcriptional regulator, arsenate/arsenite/antimonite-responsive transcriptional repressor